MILGVFFFFAEGARRILLSMLIGITFNLKKAGPRASDDRYEEYDEFSTIQAIVAQIKQLGHKVRFFEQDRRLFARLRQGRPDFVVNLAEGIGCGRGRESQVPCMLESLGIPFWGSDPIALGISLDKYLTNTLLAAAGVPVPFMRQAAGSKDLTGLCSIFKQRPRFIVKPRWEGSSKGIRNDSLVDSARGLKAKAQDIFDRYRQPVVIEEFLPGQEISVGLCGNQPPHVLGMVVVAGRGVCRKPFIYSLENKRQWRKRVIYQSQDKIEPRLQDRITRYAVRAFEALELRDVARIDFRLDARGVPRIIDVNPLPGLSPVYSDLPIICGLRGLDYHSLISAILEAALKRCGLC